MNKQAVLEFISKAIDDGAKIEINYPYSFADTYKEALGVADIFKAATNQNTKKKEVKGFKWLSVGEYDANLRLNVFYKAE